MSGCGPAGTDGSDPFTAKHPEYPKLLKAIRAANSERLGFTPFSLTDSAKLEGKGEGYDAMLHVYGDTDRTIGFRKTPSGYRWVLEQETYYGPRMYTNEDGSYREFITLDFRTEAVNGVPINELWVHYMGEDPRLAHPRNLTLNDVRPFLKAWKKAAVR